MSESAFDPETIQARLATCEAWRTQKSDPYRSRPTEDFICAAQDPYTGYAAALGTPEHEQFSLFDEVRAQAAALEEVTRDRDALLVGVEETVKRADLHAKRNQEVSDALGQSFGESWHDLGEKVGRLRAQLATVTAALAQAQKELAARERIIEVYEAELARWQERTR